jgi:hypothetical protein
VVVLPHVLVIHSQHFWQHSPILVLNLHFNTICFLSLCVFSKFMKLQNLILFSSYVDLKKHPF